jgi:hypothetical protein
MGDYSTIDPLLSAWASRHGLQVFTEHQDEEIRAVIFERDGVRKADLWIERPSAAGVGLHLVEFSRRGRDVLKRSDIQSSLTSLEADLDALAVMAASW